MHEGMKTTKPLVIEACVSNRLIAGVLREVRDTVEAVTGSPAVVEGANGDTRLERCSGCGAQDRESTTAEQGFVRPRIRQPGRTIIEPHDTNIELSRSHRGVGIYKGWPGGGKPVASHLVSSSSSALGSITVFWNCAIFQMPPRLTIVNEALVFAATTHVK
jgi:hypothetical protein